MPKYYIGGEGFVTQARFEQKERESIIEAGYRAARRGKKLSNNPYKNGIGHNNAEKSLLWEKGFCQ